MKVGDIVKTEYARFYDPQQGVQERYMRSYNAAPPEGSVGIVIRLKPFDMCEALFDKSLHVLHVEDIKVVK